MAEKKIKKKQHITITIDTEIYLKTRLTEDLNLSALINDFLKHHFSDDNEEEVLKQETEQAKKKLILLEYELSRIQKNKEAEKQLKLSEKEKESYKLIRAIPRGNRFYAKLQREKMLKDHPELKEHIEAAAGLEE